MGSQASQFTAQSSFVHPLRSGKAPSFLYLKNGIFYYRYRFPRWLIAHMRHTEIRVSLPRWPSATNPAATPTGTGWGSQCPPKSLVTPNEIRRRLNGYLRFMLDKDAASVTREEIRNVRDTLRKLPPSRKKSPSSATKALQSFLQCPTLKPFP